MGSRSATSNVGCSLEGIFPDEHGALNVRFISGKDEPLLRVLNATPRSQKTNVNVVLARLEEVVGSLEQSADRAAKEDEEDQEAEVVVNGLTRRILRTGRCDVTINQYVLRGFTCSAGATTLYTLATAPPTPFPSMGETATAGWGHGTEPCTAIPSTHTGGSAAAGAAPLLTSREVW